MGPQRWDRKPNMGAWNSSQPFRKQQTRGNRKKKSAIIYIERKLFERASFGHNWVSRSVAVLSFCCYKSLIMKPQLVSKFPSLLSQPPQNWDSVCTVYRTQPKCLLPSISLSPQKNKTKPSLQFELFCSP